MRKNFLSILFIFLLFINMDMIDASENITISQVIERLPDISVYLNPTNYEFNDLQVFLGNQKLILKDKEKLKESGIGTNYYILIDCSTSIPDEYLKNIKTGLIQFINGKRNQDNIQIYSFGESLTKVTDSSQSQKLSIEKINHLHNTQKKTQLFRSISLISEYCDNDNRNNNHNVIFVVSDGKDFARGQTTSQEALNILQEKNVPVYGIALDSSYTKDLDHFGEFSRETGGYLKIYDEKKICDGILLLKRELDDSWVLHFDYGTNIVTNKEELMTIKDNQSRINVSKKVKVIHYQKDDINPYIQSIEVINQKQMKVIFSENVKNCENINNYTVQCNDKELSIDRINYSLKDGYNALFTFKDELHNGEYSIKCHNIVDNTMEENELKQTYTYKIDYLKNETSYILFLVTGLIAFIFIIVFVIMMKRKNKKEKQIEGAEEFDCAEEGYYIDISDQTKIRKSTKTIVIDVIKEQQLIETLNIDVNHDIVFGRAKECDYYCKDMLMSKKHFMLKYHDDCFFVVDLQSRNGTKINGIKFNHVFKLTSGDIIQAGQTKFKVR